MKTATEIKAIVDGVQLPLGVSVDYSGRTIRVWTSETRKGSAKPLYAARRAIVAALLAADIGRKLTGPKAAWFVYPQYGWSSRALGTALTIRVEATEEEHQRELLGCGGIFAAA